MLGGSNTKGCPHDPTKNERNKKIKGIFSEQ